MKTKSRAKNKVNVITLGCSKNLVDSEVLMGQLKANDFDVQHESNKIKDSEIVIINTCGFIEQAKQESINTIIEYSDLKSEGKIDQLIVTGCLSERYKDDLVSEFPEVDAFFGTMELPNILKKLGADYKHELIGERYLTTSPHYAYLKISEGCNRTCAFCAIPLMRGQHVSRKIEDLVEEAKHLAKNGVKEIMLIAQELTYYGLDIYKERRLNALLQALAQVEGIEWIRLHYAYPTGFPLDILDEIRENQKVCAYIDIPFQHAANGVLKRMRRGITREETEALIATIREKVPGITLRTTMLVGFPGETEAEFEELCDFVRRMKFNRLGVFTYSHEDNTRAFEMEDDISEELKQKRANALMDIQQGISESLNKEKVGKVMKVMIDRKEGKYFVGRTEGDSPEVDNEVLIAADKNYCRVGDFVKVTITGAEEFDLFAEPVK
ncbi:MAG: 30S ribosomal protein S12 methylthiotransferase RimO [Chitinophagales bacterium]|nr:30S ribosomal protein S12 methylthiotransferase RimO [Chitinophagales bacterium]